MSARRFNLTMGTWPTASVQSLQSALRVNRVGELVGEYAAENAAGCILRIGLDVLYWETIFTQAFLSFGT